MMCFKFYFIIYSSIDIPLQSQAQFGTLQMNMQT